MEQVIAVPRWDITGEWYNVLLVSLFNVGNVDVVNPIISFDTEQCYTLSMHSNFNFSVKGNRVTGMLGYANTIPVNKHVEFKVVISKKENVDILPNNFSINDTPSYIPEEIPNAIEPIYNAFL